MNATVHSRALRFKLAALPEAAAAGHAGGGTAAARRGRLDIVIAGGGTGGHLFPGIALAEEIRRERPESRVLFVSRGNEFERGALSRAGFALAPISAEGFKGRGAWHQLRALSRLPRGVLQSARVLKDFGPQLVVGLGSYSAAPVVAAAWLMRVPIALCEQNTLPGITNRALAPLADRIYTSFERTQGRFDPRKVLWTGNPLRRELVAAAAERLSWPPAGAARERFTVLVIGGSQGAHSINTAVVAAVERLVDDGRLFFIHQTGAADEQMVRDAYRRLGVAGRVQAFYEDMTALYRQADLVLCRAGATTVAEITALGKAAVFVPFPHAADDHQRLNALRLSEQGAAEMIADAELSGPLLCARIRHFMAHPQELRALAETAARQGRPDAARRIVEDCLRLVTGPQTGRPARG
jgi:UDP-N-acetylglucosamine--N-acetylmuramyl-(pentapeptide) pyrophosphoryl-undecaprenol N-acetylglucosamine transferase